MHDLEDAIGHQSVTDRGRMDAIQAEDAALIDLINLLRIVAAHSKEPCVELDAVIVIFVDQVAQVSAILQCCDQPCGELVRRGTLIPSKSQ